MDCERRALSISEFSSGWISCIFIAWRDVLILNGRRRVRNPIQTMVNTNPYTLPAPIAPHHGRPREFIHVINDTTQVEGLPTATPNRPYFNATEFTSVTKNSL